MTAPGKLFLVGEYAVLDGAPAVVIAVDRGGVRCTWTPGPDLEIHTPAGDDRFVRAALLASEAPPGRWAFTDEAPPNTPDKPGLGGSAAATVAATLAGLAAQGHTPTPDEVCRRATRVHRDVQGGGSGADVAASAHGGSIRFQAGAVSPGPPLCPVVLWLGRSARTGPRVARYRDGTDRSAFVEACAGLADLLASDPVRALQEAGAALDGLAGIDVWTDEARALHTLATVHGGAAKPSGAGGGDCAVALFRTDAGRAAFLREAAARGTTVIPLALAPAACVLEP